MTAAVCEEQAYRRFIATVSALHPRKSFGYLLGSPGDRVVTDFYIFQGDLRSTDAGREMFEPVGRYYRDHADAGFLAPAAETLAFERDRRARGLTALGMFHVHLRHPPFLAAIDRDLHADPGLWHMIVSLRSPAMPDAMVYVPDRDGELRADRLTIVPSTGEVGPPPGRRTWEQLVAGDLTAQAGGRIEELVASALDQGITVPAPLILALVGAAGPGGAAVERFFESRASAGALVAVDRVRHGSLWWARRPVTIGAYRSVMSGVEVGPEAAELPMTQVDADEAALFARLLGGRLPTLEEYRAFVVSDPVLSRASRSAGDLADHAVFSENAARLPEPVASRRPDAHGAYDMQGLVWEWVAQGSDRAVVGGSRFAFPEMCGPDVALPTPSDYRAGDIGFRVCWDDRDQ